MRRAEFLFGFALAVLVTGPALLPLSAEAAGRGEKESIAVFALGYSALDVPLESIGAVDNEIRKLFTDLGRYKVIAMAQRLSSRNAEELIDALAEAEGETRAAEYPRRFGDVSFTKAEFGRLSIASILAVPMISELNSFFDEAEGRWETDIVAGVALFDMSSGGQALGVARVESSGYDGTERDRSASAAVEGIPMLLQYELRKVEAFRIDGRVLSLSGEEVELGLGSGAGVKKGDEYEALATEADGGDADSSSLGLVAIKKVGSRTSAGKLLYSRSDFREGARLVEVPRLGVDVEPYLHFVVGAIPDLALDRRSYSGACAVAGLRVPVSRGFYGLRPYAAIQVPTAGVRGFGSAFLFPVDLLVGAEYRMISRRLSFTPYCGAGAGFIYASETIYGESANSADSIIPHIGGHAYLDLAFLASRDIRIFADLGGEYWISTVPDLYTDYGGVGFGAGVSIKL